MKVTSACDILLANQIIRNMWSRTIIDVPLALTCDPVGGAIVLCNNTSDDHILIRY